MSTHSHLHLYAGKRPRIKVDVDPKGVLADCIMIDPPHGSLSIHLHGFSVDDLMDDLTAAAEAEHAKHAAHEDAAFAETDR